jgi:hypothetical protein
VPYCLQLMDVHSANVEPRLDSSANQDHMYVFNSHLQPNHVLSAVRCAMSPSHTLQRRSCPPATRRAIQDFKRDQFVLTFTGQPVQLYCHWGFAAHDTAVKQQAKQECWHFLQISD